MDAKLKYRFDDLIEKVKRVEESLKKFEDDFCSCPIDASVNLPGSDTQLVFYAGKLWCDEVRIFSQTLTIKILAASVLSDLKVAIMDKYTLLKNTLIGGYNG